MKMSKSTISRSTRAAMIRSLSARTRILSRRM